MADDHDYGFYGKGLDGYVHYRQAMQESGQQNRAYRPGQVPANRDLTPEENRKARAWAIVVAMAVVVVSVLVGLFLC